MVRCAIAHGLLVVFNILFNLLTTYAAGLNKGSSKPGWFARCLATGGCLRNSLCTSDIENRNTAETLLRASNGARSSTHHSSSWFRLKCLLYRKTANGRSSHRCRGLRNSCVWHGHNVIRCVCHCHYGAAWCLAGNQGRSDGGYIGIYTLPKSVPENYFVH